MLRPCEDEQARVASLVVMINNGPSRDVPAGATGPIPPPPSDASVPAGSLPGPPLDVAAILQWAWRTYLRKAPVLIGLTLLLVAPVAVISGALGGNQTGGSPGVSVDVFLLPVGGSPVALSLGLLSVLGLQPIYLVAIYRATSGTYLGDAPGLAFLLRQGVRRFPGMLLINVWLAIAFLAVGAIGTAIVLFIVVFMGIFFNGPSEWPVWIVVASIVPTFFILLYFFTRLQLSNAIYIVENTRGRAAVGRSWLLTQGRFWRCLGAFLSAAFLGGVVNFALGAIARQMTGIELADGNVLTGAAVALGQLFTAPFMTLVTTAVLFAARGETEPLDHGSALAALRSHDR